MTIEYYNPITFELELVEIPMEMIEFAHELNDMIGKSELVLMDDKKTLAILAGDNLKFRVKIELLENE